MSGTKSAEGLWRCAHICAPYARRLASTPSPDEVRQSLFNALLDVSVCANVPNTRGRCDRYDDACNLWC